MFSFEAIRHPNFSLLAEGAVVTQRRPCLPTRHHVLERAEGPPDEDRRPARSIPTTGNLCMGGEVCVGGSVFAFRRTAEETNM